MKLSEYISKAGITQAEFGKKIGRSQTLISAYCNGTLIPPRATALDIVKETQGAVTLADLWPDVKIA